MGNKIEGKIKNKQNYILGKVYDKIVFYEIIWEPNVSNVIVISTYREF